jgi:hypothetical protein
MELLEVYLRTTYFQVGGKYFQQGDGMAMGSSLSPVVSYIYMEHFENLALDSTLHKPSLWLLYFDDTFAVWPHGPEQLQDFPGHLNSLRPTIQFTMEIVRQCDSLLGCFGHQEGDDNDCQSLQKSHPHWPISQFQFHLSATRENKFSL